MVQSLSLIADAAIPYTRLFQETLDVCFEHILDADIESSYNQGDDVVFYPHELSDSLVLEIVIKLFVVLVVHDV